MRGSEFSYCAGDQPTTSASMASRSNGLLMTASAPTPSADRSPAELIRITAIAGRPALALSRRQSSAPFKTGIMMSEITRSGCSLSTISSACAPWDGLERSVTSVREQLVEEVAHRLLVVHDQDCCHAVP
jgi:hypothetical protein